jgi:ribosomal-protein-alanine N-acetyltransferase
MTPPLRTDRLILRPLELADAEQVQQLFPQWEIVRLLNARIPWPFPHDGVLSYYQRDALPAMERGDEWHWTLRLHTNPSRILGAIGLFRKGDDNRGFWLDPAMQGNGLMTEAVIAVTDFWFDVLHFQRLRAPKATANTASRNISQATGMSVIQTTERDFVSGRLPAEVWEITADRWHQWRAERAPMANTTNPMSK